MTRAALALTGIVLAVIVAVTEWAWVAALLYAALLVISIPKEDK
jgi:hypothetical protein